MENQKKVQTDIAEGMKRALGCEVIASNQTGPSPSYPYVSFTVTTPVVSDGKGWARDRDGREFKDLAQIWSFTVQSEDPFQAAQIALDAYEWLSTESGNLYLSLIHILPKGIWLRLFHGLDGRSRNPDKSSDSGRNPAVKGNQATVSLCRCGRSGGKADADRICGPV